MRERERAGHGAGDFIRAAIRDDNLRHDERAHESGEDKFVDDNMIDLIPEKVSRDDERAVLQSSLVC